MEKVKLDIVGLSYSQTHTGAYALVLGETEGKRRLPIIIGGFEAQAIAIELEKMTPSRPLTHDLFKNFSQSFGIEIKEIIIYNLVEGIFYSKLVSFDGTKTIEIDARTSDAIAIAVRFNCPIYTYEFILAQAGIILDEKLSLEKEIEAQAEKKEKEKEEMSEVNLHSTSVEDLKSLLEKAIDAEEYERASKIRDELKKRKAS